MSEAVILKLESTMHSLTERVGRHEDRLEAAINNMSNKLDALVEISRTMATLQERQTQHADGIAELKNDMREQREQHAETIREILVAHEKTVGRLHERIDQLDRHIGSVAQEVKAAVAERVREEGAFHDKVTKLSHEWELRYAHSEKDQLNQTAEFAASLGALEKRFDNFFANVEGMKKMAYVLWAVMVGDPVRAFEYQWAEQEALAFKNGGYAGAVPSSISAWTQAKNWTAQQAADDILAAAQAFRTAMSGLRSARLIGKEGVRNAATDAAADQAYQTAIASIRYIRSQVSV